MPPKTSRSTPRTQPSPAPAGAFAAIVRNHYIYVALFAVLTGALYSQFLFSDKMLQSSDQLTGIDSRVVLRDAIVEHGQFPAWMQSRLSGMPSVDAMFGDAMYPPSLLFYTLFPMHRALGLIMVEHVFLAGVLFYVMMVRGFGAHPLVAFAGAALYMLNPEFVSHTYPGHSGKMMVIALLPLVVWRMKALMDKPTVLNGSLLALGISACLFTSHTQMTYFVLWGLFLYWVVSAAIQWYSHHDARRLVPMSGLFWGAVVFGVALAFIQFYPSFAFVRAAFSVRGVDRGFEYAASWSLHWPEFFSLIVPEFGNFLENYWNVDQSFQFGNVFKLNTEYGGAMALLFAIVAVVFKPRKPWRIFWAALALLAVFYSLGAHTPVFRIAYYLIPGVKKFRACSMIMFWFSFATVLLASLFLMDVMRGELSALDDARKKNWQRGLLVAIGAVTLLALVLSARGFVAGMFQDALSEGRNSRVFERNFGENFVPALWMWWFMTCASLGILFAVIRGKVSPYTLVAAVLVFGVFDTVRIDRKFIQVINPRQYFFTSNTLKEISDRMEQAPFRCFSLPGTFSQNAEGIHHLEGVGDFHDNELRWYRDFRGDQRNTNFLHGILQFDSQGRPFLNAVNLPKGNNFLNLANVRYYLAGQGGQIQSLENEGDLGRLSFATDYVVMKESEIADALKQNRYDIRTTVALLEEPDHKPAPAPAFAQSDSALAPPPAKARVEWKEYTPNYRKAAVSVERDGFLRVSEVYYPGWRIRIDDAATRIYRADLAWMAVYIAAGEHTVEMLPKSLYLGTASMVSFPLMILLALYWAWAAYAHYRLRGKQPRAS